ncbi:MAG TPA: zinc metalloprotease HtpX [Solirubrobacterales bacterium]|nr:zinc metalloprotease HtpX [Solirubrobacterales bacterium]
MNWLKTGLLMIVLTVLLVLIGRFAFGGAFLGFFVVLAVILNGVSYWFSDRIALASARAKEVSAAEAPMLHRLAERLSVQYRVPKPGVYVSPDPTPNAFATGRNPHHAAICVNEGLLQILDEEELYGVLAHEFAHVRNRDILISSVVAVIAGAITLIANVAQWSMWFGGFGNDEDEGIGGLAAGLALIILGPIAAMLIQLAISRSREFEADHTGAEVSGDPLALASALRKLQAYSNRVASPVAQPAFAHLYIVNPLGRRALSGLFSTHPPIEERVRRLEAMASGIR